MLRMISGPSASSGKVFEYFRKLVRAQMRADGSRPEEDTETVPSSDEEDTSTDTVQFSDEAAKMVNELDARNSEVLAHESAHIAAAGAWVMGGASYTYQTGPDGKRYAIGGEVKVDMSPIPGNPRATINKMAAIRAAALSPASPSPDDLAVAAAASRIEEDARSKLNQEATAAVTGQVGSAAKTYSRQGSVAGLMLSASR